MNINLNIDELIFYGFDPGDQAQITVAIQQALTRLLTEQGLPAGVREGQATPLLDGGQITIQPGVKAETIGRQVAQAIYTGLGVVGNDR